MSRSWERKVNKNMSQLNKQRKKQGLSSYQGSTISDKSDVFKGRKYVLPLVLVALAGCTPFWALQRLGQQEEAMMC